MGSLSDAEYPVNTVQVTYDQRGRQDVTSMSDRALLQEIVTTLRNATDIAERIAESANSNPMLRAMMPKL